jgi:hypothetical protein
MVTGGGGAAVPTLAEIGVDVEEDTIELSGGSRHGRKKDGMRRRRLNQSGPFTAYQSMAQVA